MKRVLIILALALAALGGSAVLWFGVGGAVVPEGAEVANMEELARGPSTHPFVLVLAIKANSGITMQGGELIGPADKVDPLERILEGARLSDTDASEKARHAYTMRVLFPAGTDINEVLRALVGLPFFVRLYPQSEDKVP